MSNINYRHAESLIFYLKQSIDGLWRHCEDGAILDSLIYADKEYGAQQREELKEILNLLRHIKKNVDGLSTDCRAIEDNTGEEVSSNCQVRAI